MTKKKHIAFFTPYPFDKAPSQRFRFEQYLSFLKENGLEYEMYSFVSASTWKILYLEGNHARKILGVLSGFLNRFIHVLKCISSDYVFVHREMTPIGPPIFEWFVAKVLRKKIIYDFDDAIWLANTSKENMIVAGLKAHSKAAKIAKWSYKSSCGNEFLRQYAEDKGCEQAVFNPTTINLKKQQYKLKSHTQKEVVTLGWTGTHSTMRFLDLIIADVRAIAQIRKVKFLVISNHPPIYEDDFIEYKKWENTSEIDDLLRFDIGLMPLSEDKWSKGKCGFKALQYMSLGIPTLLSPVGVNTDIVTDNQSGLLCTNNWQENMINLVDHVDERKRIGEKGFEVMKETYSTEANRANFLSLFS